MLPVVSPYQSASMVFYEAELEREALLREQREREDEEMMRDSRNGGDGNDAQKSGNQTGQSLNGNADSQLTRDPTPATAGLKRLVPPSAASALYVPPSLDPSRSRLIVPPSAQLGSTGFYAPVSAMPNMGRDRVFIPPPPSAVGGGSLAPPSMMPFAPPTASICSNAWSSGLHNVVTVPGGPPLQLQQQQQQFRPPDTVLIPTRSKTVRTNGQANADTGAFVYKPLELDLFGPRMPTESHVRWSDLVNTYVDTIIASIRGDRPRNLVKLSEDSGGHMNPDESAPPAKRIKSEEDIKPTVCGVGDAGLRSTKPEDLDNKMSLDDSFPNKKEEPLDSSTHVGLSEQLPQGACGIAPQVFLERCLQESRCALFI
ncbi:unnamed protein product [Calicophoron daubneyi]|uniref:Uncharacterized protein n=1 Tax=Calicophoron daubneyi TaxID=300641 RepID=A0AAV2SWI6_CALDB